MKKEDLTYKIRGAIFEVNRVLGHGFLEKVYENALMVELQERGLKADSQVAISVQYKKTEVGEYFADIVVAVESLQKIHEAQILNYLNATDYKVGFLVNFTHSKAVIRRFVL